MCSCVVQSNFDMRERKTCVKLPPTELSGCRLVQSNFNRRERKPRAKLPLNVAYSACEMSQNAQKTSRL
jgi:hypothetical protein